MAIQDSLTILTEEEVRGLYEVPKIDPEDRDQLFEITPEDQSYLDELTDSHNKIDYLLQLGYFRAVRQFYKFKFEDVRDDVWFIINNHFPTVKFPKKEASRNKYYAAQKVILNIYDFKRYDAKSAIEFDKQAKRLSKRDLSAKFIFDELLGFCEHQKTVRPKYSTLQSLVSSSISREENRLGERLGRLLSKSSRETLDKLLNNDDTISDLTLLKQDPKTFATNHMRKELEKHQKVTTLFQESKHIISELGISRQNIQYYAEICDFYEPHQLRRFNQKKSRLCMLCFVWQRFIKINDHLVTYMAHKTDVYEELAIATAMASVLEAKLGVGKDRKIASKILKIIHNEKVDPVEIRPQCYKIVKKDKFDEFTNKLANPEIDQKEYEWQYYSKEHGSIKLNIRPTFMAIDFNCDTNVKLERAIKYAKTLFLSKDKTTDPYASEIPIEFIPAIQLKYLTYKKIVKKTSDAKRKTSVKFINIKRYEVMLYRAIANAINSGSIFVSNSVNYRHLEDELIPMKKWLKDKDKILEELSDCLLLTPIVELLKYKKENLEELYKTVNDRINSGKNKEIKLDDKHKFKWTLPYKRAEDKANNPFYDKIQTTSITNVMDYTAKYTNFFDSFTHILNKGSRSQALPEHLKAYFVSQGASIGNKRMAESSDVSLDNLNKVGAKFVRFNTLVDASNQIINNTAQLPIFQYYNLSDYGIHASLDGQKVETKYQTILSRYSTKYFGYGKGVVSYSLIANHLPVNTKIIGANEHESHHVLDIVYYNSSDLNITAISGDMHSVNRVNFALMNLFRYDFMPRFTQINSKVEKNLVSFENPSQYENLLIKPSSQVKTELIIDEWYNILRILASLALKETTQSIIIKKLSSYSKTNPTLKALIEYDKIIMSTYMLNYIDDITLRRRVYRALNRGESFHQLRSAILQISGKKLLGKTDIAFEVSNQCNKLLACCMIYYNTSILSELLARTEAEGNKELCDQIKRLSPVAWQHINLLGNFTFKSKENIVDIKEFINFMLEESEKGNMPETFMVERL